MRDPRSPRKATPLLDRYHLCFALGKALEDRARIRRIVSLLRARQCAEKSRSCATIAAALERNVRRQASVCTGEFFAARRGMGCAGSIAHFHRGLAARRLDVDGANPRLAFASGGHQGARGYSAARAPAEWPRIERLDAALSRGARRIWVPNGSGISARNSSQTPASYRQGRPFFIDKMPNNFRHIGLIHLILPNAKIIDARREPMACCFSNFKQLFASGQEFTYGLEDIGRYYRNYLELMEHWEAALPAKILQGAARGCGREPGRKRAPHAGFLRARIRIDGASSSTRRERSIRTASSEQVRRPIFKEGLDQWRNFEPWLAPLKALRFDAAARADNVTVCVVAHATNGCRPSRRRMLSLWAAGMMLGRGETEGQGAMRLTSRARGARDV